MTMTAKFAGHCKRCHCGFAAGATIDWQPGVGATHATTAACDAARAARPKPQATAANAVTQKPIADFLLAAKARGLKFPKARFLAPGNRELRLSVAGAQSRTPGAIQVVIGEDEWQGRIMQDGSVEGKLASDSALLATLNAIAADPATAAKAYGALMCRCSFCDKALTDDGSVEVGYGPVCAEKYGLPHTAKGTRVLVTKAPKAAPEPEPEPAPVFTPALSPALRSELEQELDNVYTSLSDGDEIPPARKAALLEEVAVLTRLLGR